MWASYLVSQQRRLCLTFWRLNHHHPGQVEGPAGDCLVDHLVGLEECSHSVSWLGEVALVAGVDAHGESKPLRLDAIRGPEKSSAAPG
jgi:hypothetical protein